MNAPDLLHDGADFALSPEQRALPPHADAVSLTVEIVGVLQLPRLRAAVRALVLRHPQLRARFGTVDGYRGLRQRIVAPAAAGLDIFEVSAGLQGDDPGLAPQPESSLSAAPASSPSVVSITLQHQAPQGWRLVLRMPALVADRRSMEILYRDLVRLYLTPAAQAPGEPLQYDEFVAWRRDIGQGEDADAGRAYWSGVGGQPPLRLPYRDHAVPATAVASNGECDAGHGQKPNHNHNHDHDHDHDHNYGHDVPRPKPDRPANPAAHAEAQAARGPGDDVPPGVASSLLRLAVARDVPLAALLQAAWWALLARIQGRGQFSAGWRHDCRRDYEVMDGAVGVFEKILPLNIDLALDEPFGDWLLRCAGMLGQHVQAQEFAPLSTAKEGESMLAAGFACGDLSMPVHHDGVDFACGPLPAAIPCFELELLVELDAEGLPRRLNLRHAHCYSAAAATRLLQQLSTLLAGLEQEHVLPIDRLSLVGAQERAALLALSGPTLDTGGRMLPQRVADWAHSAPQAPALQARDLVLDYGQLDQRVSRMAHRLRALGVSTGSIVALALPRSGAQIVALLAVLRAGGAYLPLDPEWPAARIAAILDDAKPALLLTPAEDDARHGVRCISLTSLTSLASPSALNTPLAVAPPSQTGSASVPVSAPDHVVAGADAAYVLYTSGSTGVPKGVIVEHRQLLNYALAVSAQLRLDQARRFALSSALAADLGNTTLFGALVNGACLVVADAEDMQSPAAFARFIRDGGIDCLKIVPSHLDALLDGETPVLPARVILGGEATARHLLQRLQTLSPATLLFNHYGPTETTVGVMTHAHVPGTAPPAVLPLTRVLANCRVLILDRYGALAPTGALGELHVGGAQLCRGYLNRPGVMFVADPFHPGERLYRTGDLARYLPQGGLELAGRADHQLKLRGFRVEPAEVEAALLALPGVRQAVVAPRGEDDQRRLVAWVVTSLETETGSHAVPLRTDAWLAALRGVLPDVMLPAAIVVVPHLPRLGNGKVDLRALPEPCSSSDDIERAAPASALEWLLAHLMGEILDQPAPGAHDDFFALGGHSLLVIKLVGRIRKALQLEFVPGLVFDHRTPAALARALTALVADPAHLEQVADLRRQLAGMTPEDRAALLLAAPA